MDVTTMKANNKGIRTGFRFQDDIYLRRHDNPSADPDVQIFTNETEDDEQTLFFCAMCKSKLTYMKHTNTIWKCDNCQEIYDTSIQDRPITNKGFKIRPHHSILRYPKMDDMDIPYMKGINLNEQQDSGIGILRTSQDGRIQHICLVDNCSREEAYSKMRDL